ncbi:MAG: hypothetical protein ABI129_00195, partial [Rhodanobacter sp.]
QALRARAVQASFHGVPIAGGTRHADHGGDGLRDASWRADDGRLEASAPRESAACRTLAYGDRPLFNFLAPEYGDHATGIVLSMPESAIAAGAIYLQLSVEEMGPWLSRPRGLW